MDEAPNDLFTQADAAQKQKAASNIPEMSVSQLAFSVKNTLEQSFGHVRIRGELTGLKPAASGHLYGDIKDEDAVVNIVCWRSTVSRLSVKPEDGLEVIITGKVSSYPKSSRYQIIIEKMELAGEGALLKMLEERRKKLAAEGLFDESRKKRLPLLPDVIGVVTSPTGAVIRDIMHRLDDRFPRHVLLWPVMVQGDGSAQQIARAINGFNSLDGSRVPRPDVLIVARGGGSLEDLMAFNEEVVVRAVAESTIPVISAVGHETDTTLIDHAADRRAPTPTGAAEIAVPVRRELWGWVKEQESRMASSLNRNLNEKQNRLELQLARLGDPKRLLEIRCQTLDMLSEKFGSLLKSYMQAKTSTLSEIKGRLRPPVFILEKSATALQTRTADLDKAQKRYSQKLHDSLNSVSRLLETLSFEKVLERGFVVVRDETGKPVSAAETLQSGQNIELQFKENTKRKAQILN